MFICISSKHKSSSLTPNQPPKGILVLVQTACLVIQRDIWFRWTDEPSVHLGSFYPEVRAFWEKVPTEYFRIAGFFFHRFFSYSLYTTYIKCKVKHIFHLWVRKKQVVRMITTLLSSLPAEMQQKCSKRNVSFFKILSVFFCIFLSVFSWMIRALSLSLSLSLSPFLQSRFIP